MLRKQRAGTLTESVLKKRMMSIVERKIAAQTIFYHANLTLCCCGCDIAASIPSPAEVFLDDFYGVEPMNFPNINSLTSLTISPAGDVLSNRKSFDGSSCIKSLYTSL